MSALRTLYHTVNIGDVYIFRGRTAGTRVFDQNIELIIVGSQDDDNLHASIGAAAVTNGIRTSFADSCFYIFNLFGAEV